MLEQLRKEVQRAGDVSYMPVDIATMNDLLDRIEAQSEVVEAAREYLNEDDDSMLDCPTCGVRVPVGYNCEADQHKDPPDPCGNPTRDEVSAERRLHEALDILEEQTDE